jgi:diguanylate cyclase (GGDEF)-like protein
VAPNQLKKKISRALMVSWREQPTRHDVAALQANIRRVGLVVRVRWILLVVLVVYSAVAGLLYSRSIPLADLVSLVIVPALTLGVVFLYNAYYSANYRRLGSIAVWNNVQLALDALVVTVLVYFSGGVNSWFWSMYALIIFEAAFILPRSRDVWLHGLLSVVLLGGVELFELIDWLPHTVIPFAEGDIHHSVVFVLVRYSWQLAVLMGTAWVSTMLVGEFRRELDSRRAFSLIDAETGLYSRDFFMRTLRTEVRRVQHARRAMHLMLLDIDQFGEFNRKFGIDAGDSLIGELAKKLREFVGPGDTEQMTINVAARLGGEEFGILLLENATTGAAPSCEEAEQTARALSAALAAIRVEGAGVGVSLGLASLPHDGVSCSELLDAADRALAAAVQAGGNRVFSASACPSSLDEDAAEIEV